jgi:beta-glucosidase
MSQAWGAGIELSWVEGSTPGSDWHRWTVDQQRGPRSRDGNGFVSRFAEDLRLLASSGASMVRLGIDWTSLMPAPRRWNDQAAEHINDIIGAARDAGLGVWLSLHRVDLPGWFVDERDFRDDTNRAHWSRYVDGCGERFGDHVGGWIAMMEPIAWAANAFRSATRPPGRADEEQLARAVRGVLLAHRDAYRQLRGGPPVATAFDLGPMHPVDPSIPAEKQTRLWKKLRWDAAITAIGEGTIEIPGLRVEGDVPDLRDCCDIVGFTYQHAVAVERDGSWGPWPAHVTPGPLGWAPWAEGIAWTLRELHQRLPDRSLAIVGIGVPGEDDRRRLDVLGEELDHVAEAVHDGADVRFVCHDGWVDGYRPESGTKHPWGLIADDRHPKTSLEAFTTRR